jgi:signal transduction histidine kinase
VELDRRLPPLVGDRHRLIQTVSELINNAIKFADAGSRVTVRTRREAEEAVVEVASVGPAIGTEEREGLFEKFHQMDQSNTRRSGGFGLGLYLARSIAVMHGGSIGIVEGTRPEETVFQVRLPVDAARLASAAIGQA